MPLGPAAAGVRLAGSFQWVSDYRYRGLSLSNGRPALQAGIEAERRGWFAAGWGTVSASGEAGSEADLTIGHRGALAGLRYSASAEARLYNSAGDPRSIELVASVGRRLGAASLDVELAYAPRQSGSGTDNLFLGAQFAWPIPATPLSAQLHGGFEDGFYRRKLDWEAGLSAPLGPVTLSASLVGATGRGVRRGTGLILALGRSW
jgi:uncharacterized protein (TIGR02001 family)